MGRADNIILASPARGCQPGFAASFGQLIRPRLLVAVLVAMAAAAWATTPSLPGIAVAHALAGVGLVAAGASAMNQVMERRVDAAMARTALRPLPSGRFSAAQVATWALLGSLAGILYLAALSPPLVATLAAGTWILYVAVYTPLKRATVWHTPLGAVAGAMPVVLGAAAGGNALSPASVALFAVVFFWQFPHTAAIGWIYRDQYARSEMKVAAVVDPSGRLAGWMALAGVAGLLATGIILAILSRTGCVGGLLLVCATIPLTCVAARLLKSPTDAVAQMLRRVALLYLPMALAAVATRAW